MNTLYADKTKEIIYVVDDDEAVRDSLSWLLESNGYLVKCFSSAERFLQAVTGSDREVTSLSLIHISEPTRPY